MLKISYPWQLRESEKLQKARNYLLVRQSVRNESERRGAAVRAKAFVFTQLSIGFRVAEVVVNRHLVGRENEISGRHFCQQLTQLPISENF